MLLKRFVLLAALLCLYVFIACQSNATSPATKVAGDNSPPEYCVTGNNVRLRDRPGLNGKILRNYFWLDSFKQMRPVGDTIELNGRAGQWMKVNATYAGVSIIDWSGFIFSPYLEPCDKALSHFIQNLNNESIDWQDRIFYIHFSFGNYHPNSRSFRLTPGPALIHRWSPRDSIYVVSFGLESTQAKKVGTTLVVDWKRQEYEAQGNRKGKLSLDINIRCVYTGFEIHAEELHLQHSGDPALCEATYPIDSNPAPYFKSYPDG